MRPKLLDLFCGAGGCAVGYHRAGFDVVGVDNRPQPNYPFPFVKFDALEALWVLVHGGRIAGFSFREFSVIHASPPCQKFTQAQRLQNREHEDLLTPTLEAMKDIGITWVLENVVGAPLPGAVTVCGLAIGAGVKRHRLFASSSPITGTACPPGHPGNWYTVFGGGAARFKWDNRRRATASEAKSAMGIDWMTRDELSQSIPPAYTEFIGKQLILLATTPEEE